MTSVSGMFSAFGYTAATAAVPDRSWHGCGQCQTRGHCQTRCEAACKTYAWSLNSSGATVVKTYEIVHD
eukprot:5937592-Heterocapsa_arctica.AAC.1